MKTFKSIGMDFRMRVIDYFGGTALIIEQPQTGAYVILQDDIGSDYQKYQKAPEQFMELSEGTLSYVMRKLAPYLDDSSTYSRPIFVQHGFGKEEIRFGRFEVRNSHLYSIHF